MTDSSSQSDDTYGGGDGSGNANTSNNNNRICRNRGRRKNATTFNRNGSCNDGNGINESNGINNNGSRKRKGILNAKERNLRRLESNERERMRMHSLNDAFQVN